jgi:hypothetical protein
MGHDNIVNLLVDSGADPSAQNKKDETALLKANNAPLESQNKDSKTKLKKNNIKEYQKRYYNVLHVGKFLIFVLCFLKFEISTY